MKTKIKKILQRLLGMETYLYVFALFVIRTLRFNKREGDFCFFLKQIQGEGILLDIGANIGVMTYYMAKRFPSSKVYSFEPVPVNVLTLKKIIKRFGLDNVEVCEYALGNENGEAEVVMPELERVKMQGLSHIVHESIEEMNEGEKYKTSIKKLDELDFICNASRKVIAVKLDVENFEYYVLKGAENMLEEHRPFVYSELWDNDNRKKCFDLMLSLNYSVKVLEDKELVDYDSSKHRTQNFFFLPS